MRLRPITRQQAAAQLANVPEIDEMIAPSDGGFKTQEFLGVKAKAMAGDTTPEVSFIEDVGALVDSTLNAEMNDAQHVVPDVAGLT